MHCIAYRLPLSPALRSLALQVVKKVLADMNAEAKGSIGANEKLIACLLVSGNGPKEGKATANGPWTPENKCLTASNKLNRKPIQALYGLCKEVERDAGEAMPAVKAAGIR